MNSQIKIYKVIIKDDIYMRVLFLDKPATIYIYIYIYIYI